MYKRNNKAFSLIELMVVIAIIAILASVSIPNYFNYVSKAKQAEVMHNLASIHTAEQLYFAENGEFTSKLQGKSGLDWQPGGYKENDEPKFNYTYGFNHSSAQEKVDYFTGKQKTPKEHLINTYANKKGFIAAACCDLDQKGKIDVWTIDENRNIKHEQRKA